MRDNPVRQFFRRHRAAAVGSYPIQPLVEEGSEKADELVDLTSEIEDPDRWVPLTPSEQPARQDEFPIRFVDGCITGEAVTWLRNPTHGWPVAVYLAEVGGVAMALDGRTLQREFFGLERVVSFGVDAFPWDEIESFAVAIANLPDFAARLLPAHFPDQKHNWFDYEVWRKIAHDRAHYEMQNWETVAFEAESSKATLLDGPLSSRAARISANRKGLLIAVIKTHSRNYLHDQGWRTLHDLRPGKRTPFFQIHPPESRKGAALPVATWYLKLAGSDMPNWGIVRVEVPWEQFIARWPTTQEQSGFVHRLSRWLIGARCRQESYTRMPVSLEPIVRAEESLKSLFTPFGVLKNRFLRHAGIFGSARL